MSDETYTVREPGMTAWADGLAEREAIEQLRIAHARGLRRARIYRDSDDCEVVVDVGWRGDYGLIPDPTPSDEEARELTRDGLAHLSAPQSD